MRLTLPRATALVASVLVLVSLAADAEAAGACREAADSAQDLRREARLREARQQLLVCVQKTCKDVIRNDCEKWLREIDEQTPSIVVRAVDSRGHDVMNARVSVDDTVIELDGTPVKVDPGPRTIKGRTKSGDVAEQKTLVVQGEKARVVELRFDRELNQDGTAAAEKPKPVAPKPEEPVTAPSNVVPLTLAVVGGVALLSFTYFELAAQSGYGDLKDGCGKTSAGCTDAETDPVKTQFVAAGLSLGLSVIALGAAAIVYFTRKPAATSFRPFAPVLTF